ncbi:MAG TPA: DUF1028 domain-containing protein [Candidatus Marinimicrobia bacterium]|nr:DUF1028 domain-containing protein [Candidatus Neomarinimicrobiota bacterium]
MTIFCNPSWLKVLLPLDGISTFSIVAVNPATGEVGSAGASCIAGSIIISDIHPGVGAIHTQFYWNQSNQDSASSLMNLEYSPEEIIDWLIENDAQNNPSIRQYGIIDLIDDGRSAGFTGENCFDYKNHILGQTYAIQGNILLGQEILDSMEIAFTSTYGTLDEKLIAALLAANVPGADTRCLPYGTPALSAFIRMAKSEDENDSFFMDINVQSCPTNLSPIDSLFTLYWDWKSSQTMMGDINFDRKIDIHDLMIMADFMGGNGIPSELEIEVGDLNGDGSIALMDIYLMLYEIIGIIG